MSEGAPALLCVADLAKTFDVSRRGIAQALTRAPRALLRAVDGVSFGIGRGETLALVGESGCGKSTLARMVVGLVAPTRGSVTFDGVTLYGENADADAAQRRRARASMQMIFQDPYASLNPRWRVVDIVGEPIAAAEPETPPAERTARVRALLAQVGLSGGDLDKFPHQFSGGQRQRISIARALSTRPALVVCDEPTSALDVSVQAQVLNLMRDLQRQLQLAYLFISHNLAVVHHVADVVCVMYLGRIVESADKSSAFASPRHPYTRMLLDAVPDLTRRHDAPGASAASAASEVPDPLAVPPGCSFHPRCHYADARCRREVPALMPVAEGHAVACHAVAEHRLPAHVMRATPAAMTAARAAPRPGIPL